MQTIMISKENLLNWQTIIPDHVIALGFFDGLHKGHQKVVMEGKQVANQKNLPLAVMSFFPHPKSVLSKGKVDVAYLMPLEQKQQQLAQLGVDYFFIVEFTLDFASLSPEQFIQHYVIGLGAKHVVCGFDYTYGKKGAGSASTLKHHGMGELGVSIVPEVDCYGEKISSTRIRELLTQGNVSFITELIGKPYSVEWCPQNGLLPYYTLPSPGVYEVTIEGEGLNQKAVIQVLNQVEIDYGSNSISTKEKVTVTWHKKLSEEQYKAIS